MSCVAAAASLSHDVRRESEEDPVAFGCLDDFSVSLWVRAGMGLPPRLSQSSILRRLPDADRAT